MSHLSKYCTLVTPLVSGKTPKPALQIDDLSPE
jgi:hypothetical protein